MATANYFISGVWKNTDGTISHVFLHAVTNNGASFNVGVKTLASGVIALIEKGSLVKTLTWNYTGATWRTGAHVNVVTINGKKFLGTTGDSTVRDNLDNLLDMRFAF